MVRLRVLTILERSYARQHSSIQDSSIVIQAHHVEIHHECSLSWFDEERREREDVGSIEAMSWLDVCGVQR
jgi:hypothetical protein